MLEYNNSLLHRVVLPSERAYQKALIDAYNSAVESLIATDGRYTQARLRLIIKEITDELVAINGQFQGSLEAEVAEITAYDNAALEAEFQATMKTTEQLYSIPKSTITALSDIKSVEFYRIDSRGNLIPKKFTAKQMLDGIATSSAKKVRAVIMGEAILGRSPEVIARKLKPYIKTDSERAVRTVVRTLLAEASTKAQNEFYDENSDFVDNYIYVATLDASTSSICRSLDGKTFDVRKPQYTPPLHYNCRSDLVAVPKGYEAPIRPIVLPDGTIKQAPRKGYTYADAVKDFPELANKKMLTPKQYKNLLNYY